VEGVEVHVVNDIHHAFARVAAMVPMPVQTPPAPGRGVGDALQVRGPVRSLVLPPLIGGAPVLGIDSPADHATVTVFSGGRAVWRVKIAISEISPESLAQILVLGRGAR
jgi:hypothetical protein